MLRVVLFVVLASLGGCYLPHDISHTVNVAPSARMLLPVVRAAVTRLNRKVEGAPWVVRAVESEDLRDGEIVLRGAPDWVHKRNAQATTFYGNHGLLVVAATTKLTLPRAIAHELGHCMGLEHEEARDNLMYGDYDGGWELEPWQLEALAIPTDSAPPSDSASRLQLHAR